MYRMSALLLPDACNIKQAPVQGRITTVNDMTLHIAVHLERGPLRTKLMDRLPVRAITRTGYKISCNLIGSHMTKTLP